MRRALLVLLVPGLAAADAPNVQLAGAAKAIADAAATVDLRHARFGETLTIATIAPLDPAKPVDTKPLRDELAKHKLKIIDDRTHGAGAVITVEAANGVRARVAVDQGGGTVAMTARPTTAPPPGKCVPVPQARHPVTVHSRGTNQRGESSEGSSFWDYKTEHLHDVDGDAIADAFVPVAKTKTACPEDVAFRVYVMRGACGHDVGVIGPGSFQWDAATVALDASGFRPFTMEAQSSKRGKRGIPEMTTTTRRFAVKRGKYVQVDIKRTTGVCHHCATWHCSAP